MAAARFGATARLRSPLQFQRVFAIGRRRLDDCFVLIVAGNDNGCARLGLAISKRRARRAVDRNRIKRVVRESFRQAAAALPAIDVVVLARAHTAQCDNGALFASLSVHWRQLIDNANHC